MFVIQRENIEDRETSFVTAIAMRSDAVIAEAYVQEIVAQRVKAGGELGPENHVHFHDHDEFYWIDSVEDTG